MEKTSYAEVKFVMEIASCGPKRTEQEAEPPTTPEKSLRAAYESRSCTPVVMLQPLLLTRTGFEQTSWEAIQNKTRALCCHLPPIQLQTVLPVH